MFPANTCEQISATTTKLNLNAIVSRVPSEGGLSKVWTARFFNSLNSFLQRSFDGPAGLVTVKENVLV